MPPNRFESEVESFLEGSHGDRTHIKRADHPRLHHYAGRYCRVLRPVREKVRPARPDGGREREKVRPACSKWPKMGVLWRAGRSFSRLRLMECCAGRTFSRKCRWKPRAGRVFSRVNAKGPFVGRSFSWSCCGTGMSGELCRGAEPTGAQRLGGAA